MSCTLRVLHMPDMPTSRCRFQVIPRPHARYPVSCNFGCLRSVIENVNILFAWKKFRTTWSSLHFLFPCRRQAQGFVPRSSSCILLFLTFFPALCVSPHTYPCRSLCRSVLRDCADCLLIIARDLRPHPNLMGTPPASNLQFGVSHRFPSEAAGLSATKTGPKATTLLSWYKRASSVETESSPRSSVSSPSKSSFSWWLDSVAKTSECTVVRSDACTQIGYNTIDEPVFKISSGVHNSIFLFGSQNGLGTDSQGLQHHSSPHAKSVQITSKLCGVNKSVGTRLAAARWNVRHSASLSILIVTQIVSLSKQRNQVSFLKASLSPAQPAVDSRSKG